MLVLACVATPEPSPQVSRPTSEVPDAKASPPAPTEHPKFGPLRRVVSYHESCLGSCPVYELVIDRDGSIDYSGRAFVRELGHASARVDPAVVEALFAELLAIDLEAGPVHYGDDRCEIWSTDSPENSLILEFDDHTWRVNADTRCNGNPVIEQIIEFQDRLTVEVGAERWVDPLFIGCSNISLGEDVLTSEDGRAQRDQMIEDALERLRKDASAWVIVHTGASLRDQPGASLARAERFVAAFLEAGGDPQRVEIIDEGNELAHYELGDEHIAHDEWILCRVVSRDCIDSGDWRRWRLSRE